MDGLRRKVCAFEPLWRASLGLVVVLLLITVFSLAFLTAGTESYYISLVNLVLLTALLAGNLAVLSVCRSHAERKELEHADVPDAEDG